MSEIEHRLPPVPPTTSQQPQGSVLSPSPSNTLVNSAPSPAPSSQSPAPVAVQPPLVHSTSPPLSSSSSVVPPAVVPQTNPVHPNARSTTHVANGITTTKSNITSPVCRNCKTQTTPLWRRDETGQVLCNACGLFLKLHGRPRPISLKTDTIKSRNRMKNPQSNKGSNANTPELKAKDSKINVSLTNGIASNSSSSNSSTSSGSSGKKNSPKGSSKKKSSAASTPTSKPLDTPMMAASSTMSSTSSNGFLQPQAPQTTSSNAPLTAPFYTPQVPPVSSSGVQGHQLPAINIGPLTRVPLPHHLPNHLIHQVQPLHYPLSTPTQFAPGLQRITSPLLLSTSSSVSHARSLLSTQFDSNDLGPSATFKPSTASSNSDNTVTGISLMNQSKKTITTSSTSVTPPAAKELSTPSSALAPPPPTTTLAAVAAVASAATITPATSSASSTNENVTVGPAGMKLPPFPNNDISTAPTSQTISSPSFGPQFHLSGNTNNSSTNSAIASPTQLFNGQNATLLPPLHNISQLGTGASNHNSNNGERDQQHQPPSLTSSGSPLQSYNQFGQAGDNSLNNNDNSNRNNNNNNDGNNSGSGSNAPSAAAAAEISLLKTRISELELVNDLFRTQIMELEAMEQAARMREQSMKKRLDEMIAIQHQYSAAVSGTTNPAGQQMSSNAAPATAPGVNGVNGVPQGMPTSGSATPTVLPPINVVQYSTPTLKRELEDGTGGSAYKVSRLN